MCYLVSLHQLKCFHHRLLYPDYSGHHRHYGLPLSFLIFSFLE